jgi:hypothetical protein
MDLKCFTPDYKLVGNITIGDNIKCDVWDDQSIATDSKIIIQSNLPDIFPIQAVSKSKLSYFIGFVYFFNFKKYNDAYPDVRKKKII